MEVRKFLIWRLRRDKTSGSSVGPSSPPVPRAIVGFTVGVTFTVSFIVLVVVGHQVIQGEAIVGGDEVN